MAASCVDTNKIGGRWGAPCNSQTRGVHLQRGTGTVAHQTVAKIHFSASNLPIQPEAVTVFTLVECGAGGKAGSSHDAGAQQMPGWMQLPVSLLKVGRRALSW
jgi:hypothetical protein